jgi:serine/threonine protein phosphatase PrpC
MAPIRGEAPVRWRGEMALIAFSGATDIGLRRANNEDAFVAIPESGIFAVADGMGGAASGEAASGIFSDTVVELFSGVSFRSGQRGPEMIREAFRRANERILTKAIEDPIFQGMGCTAEILMFSEERYAVGHVGDSRTYLLRKGELKQVTRDHSLVQAQIDNGSLTAAVARTHSLRHVILRAVGTDAALEVDIMEDVSLPGDLFLLCSDGLTDMIDDTTIHKVLSLSPDLKNGVANLIELANKAGGRDNITAVLCKVM